MKAKNSLSVARRPASVPIFVQIFVLAALLFAPPVAAQSVEELMNTGSELLNRGAFDQAVNRFSQAVAREPKNFEAQYNLAFAYLAWGRHSNAIDNFKKALNLRANSSQAWANLAVAYEATGKINDALNALSNAVKYDPTNVTARVNLASMYANNNKNSQAITEYMNLVKGGHNQSEILLNLAKCLITAKRIDEAKRYLQEAIVADSRNVEARWELAHIYWKNEKNPDKGLEEFKQAIKVRSDVPSFYEGMAGILEEQGKKKEAVEQLSKALIFTSEILVKERIQNWIDRLEGKTVGGPGSAGSTPQLGGMQTMKREDEPARKTTTTTPGKKVNVDFGGLMDEDDGDKKDPFGDIQKKK